MRAEYVAAGNKVHWMMVSWNRNKISWEKFRSNVLGVTDPAKAAAGSLRAQILKQWKQLELSEMPTVQDNSVHASAGPVEAMRERITWGVRCADSALQLLRYRLGRLSGQSSKTHSAVR